MSGFRLTSGSSGQARGRFRAMPGRRGKPDGVGPSLRRTSRPGGLSTARPASFSAARATAAASALGPTYSTAAPPGATSGRHHSTATAGGASAFATATPYVSVSCSPARPCTTRAFDGTHRRRNSHLRPFASSSVTSRSGSATASGIPGAPPPEPTSTTGPSYPDTTSTPRSESSRSTRRASSSSRSDVSPGVATTAASQASSVNRRDDDVAVRLRALARGLDAVELLQPQVHDLSLDGGHRLELDRLARAHRALGAPNRQRLQDGPPPLAIARRVDDHLLALVREGAVGDRVREVLARVDRLPVPADQNAEVAAAALDVHRVVALLDVDAAVDADGRRDPLHELARLRSERRLRADRRRLRRLVDGSDHARRRVADAENPPLALGDDLEPNGRLVEPRREPLELSQRGPLRLADRLAGGLDLERLLGLGAHRRAFFFFFTRLGAAAGVGFGSGCLRAAPSPPPSPSPPRGGVREERFGGGAPFFGISWRVISPWPTVHRFVVTQYRTR